MSLPYPSSSSSLYDTIIRSYTHSFFYHSLYIPHHTTSQPTSHHSISSHTISTLPPLPHPISPHRTSGQVRIPSAMKTWSPTLRRQVRLSTTLLQIDCVLAFAAVALPWLSCVMLTICFVCVFRHVFLRV